MNKNQTQTILTVLLAVTVFFFILTCSIGLPIWFRGFYYDHIEALDLPKRSGYTADQIREAYDEVLDYLSYPDAPFGTGVLPYSDEGKAHFEDCKFLFDLNFRVFQISGFVLLLLRSHKGRLAGHSGAFWGGVGALVIPAVVGALAALDFDRAFVIFHSIFFPGKTNWLFDWNADQIIRVLPQEFFCNCAILIGVGMVGWAILFIKLDRWYYGN